MANNNQIYKMSNAGGFKSLNRYYDMLAGNTTWNPWSPVGAYDSIATVTVGSGGVSSIDFTSIPSTYKHLQIRQISRSTGTAPRFALAFNADTTYTNYINHNLYGDGSSAGASVNNSSTSSRETGMVTTSSALANTFAASVVDILDYANTSKYKTTRTLTGYDLNGSGLMVMTSLLWMSTSAITQISITPYEGTGNFAQYSQFALYGVK